MTAVIKEGNAERLIYLTQINSDAFPVGDLAPEKQRLKGFEWRGEERPTDRFDITSQPIYMSHRDRYVDITRPDYTYSDRYYDDHMTKVVTDINTRAERERQRQLNLAKEEARRELDSLNAEALLRDSLSLDTLQRDTLHLEHSLRDTLLNTRNSGLHTQTKLLLVPNARLSARPGGKNAFFSGSNAVRNVVKQLNFVELFERRK